MLCLEQNPSSSTSLLPRLCDLLLRKSGVDPEKRSEVGRILGFGLDKENISEGFESTLMQNRGNLTPSPTALYSSFSSTRCQPSYESERERGRGRMRYLPRHPPFWPSFTNGQWMEKLVPRKPRGRVTKGRRRKGSGSSIVYPRPVRQLADPFRLPLLPP